VRHRASLQVRALRLDREFENPQSPVASHSASHFLSRDDGIGGADSRKGSGLIGLQDRVEALGGHMEITSPPGSGTSVHISIPLAGK
jgi:glucose-6-phosphate-specific signal transduction histidine kinase